PVSPPLQHPEQVVFAKFSPDGRWVGTVSGKTAQIWDPNTGQRLSVTNTHSIPIRFLAFSADSRRFLTVTEALPGRGDGAAGYQPDEARVWETPTGQPVGSANGVSPPGCLISPNSRNKGAPGRPPGRIPAPPNAGPYTGVLPFLLPYVEQDN